MDLDVSLKQKIKLGDDSAFSELVHSYKKKVFYFSYDLTGSQQDAQDLSQEVFLKVFKSLKNFRGDASLSSWLYRITLNTFLDQKRKLSFQKERTQLPIDESRADNLDQPGIQAQTEPENYAQSQQIQIHLQEALKKLTKKERTVFILRHYYGYKGNETADLLEVSDGTVKSLLFRAIKKLQRELSFYRDYAQSRSFGGIV